jgi:2'-hydroxyisoflavone reductase
VEKLRGDRKTAEGLEALRGRTFDAVIDTCGYVPRVVRASAELLAGSVGHYTFVSSISAYADFKTPGMDESAPVARTDDPTVEEVTGETYGPLKVLCEEAAEAALPGRVLSVRAGLIVGPHDPTDRFTYWPARVKRGGNVLAPGDPDTLVQFVDVRDLAGWMLRAVEANRTGVYNATGPDYPLTMGALLETCRDVSGNGANLVWADEDFLASEKVEPWSQMPLWVPGSDPDMAGFSAVNCNKAITDGLTFRSLNDTVRDTLAWAKTRPADHVWRAGITPEREAELLAAWRATRAGDKKRRPVPGPLPEPL